MAKQEAIEEVEKPQGGSKKRLLLIILAAAVVVLAGAGGLTLYLLSTPAEEDAGHDGVRKEDEHPPVYERLETFTVNLADQETYLQLEIQLLVTDSDVQGKIKTRMPEVRDSLIRLLSSKSPDELATQQGKDILAEEIRKQINGILGIHDVQQGVKKVLFNAFIIQ